MIIYLIKKERSAFWNCKAWFCLNLVFLVLKDRLTLVISLSSICWDIILFSFVSSFGHVLSMFFSLMSLNKLFICFLHQQQYQQNQGHLFFMSNFCRSLLTTSNANSFSKPEFLPTTGYNWITPFGSKGEHFWSIKNIFFSLVVSRLWLYLC